MTLVQRARRWVAEAALENLALKLLSFLVALIFYGYLHGAQNAQRVYSVSVVTLLPADDTGRVLLVDPPPTVRVTVLGSRPILDELRTEDLGSVQLDLRENTSTYAPFDFSHLKVPAGLKVEVDPPGLLLVWDEVVVRSVPVQIPVAGQLPPGLAVQGAPQAEPTVISARGPQSLVETLQFARVEPFDVGGLGEGPSTRKLLLEPPPARVRYLERSVLATVTIGRAKLERVFPKLPVQVTGLARAVALPPEVDVRVVGPPDVVERLRPELLLPIADAHAMAGDTRTGSMPVPVTVTVEGCTVQVVPPTVVVKW